MPVGQLGISDDAHRFSPEGAEQDWGVQRAPSSARTRQTSSRLNRSEQRSSPDGVLTHTGCSARRQGDAAPPGGPGSARGTHTSAVCSSAFPRWVLVRTAASVVLASSADVQSRYWSPSGDGPETANAGEARPSTSTTRERRSTVTTPTAPIARSTIRRARRRARRSAVVNMGALRRFMQLETGRTDGMRTEPGAFLSRRASALGRATRRYLATTRSAGRVALGRTRSDRRAPSRRRARSWG